jgi:hypothetical protein
MIHGTTRTRRLTDSGKPAGHRNRHVATGTAPDRKYLLERVDDAAVAQLYADGFSSLPLDQKDSHLASLSGRAWRAGHLLRPALRTQPRDARGAGAILTHAERVDPQRSPKFSATRSCSG